MTRKRQIGILISDLRGWLRSGFVCLCLLPLFLTALPARASDQIAAANNVITSMVSQVETYLETDSGNIEKRTEDITKLLDTHFDLPAIARFSAGPYWRAANEQERIDYVQTMRDVVIGTVVRNFDQLSGLRFTKIDSQARATRWFWCAVYLMTQPGNARQYRLAGASLHQRWHRQRFWMSKSRISQCW